MFTFFFFFVVLQHTRSLSSFAILFTLEQLFGLLWRKNAPEMDAISVTSANSLLKPRNNQGSVIQLQFGWTHQECYIINLFPPLPLFPAITTTTSELHVKWQGLINKASWIDFLFHLFFSTISFKFSQERVKPEATIFQGSSYVMVVGPVHPGTNMCHVEAIVISHFLRDKLLFPFIDFARKANENRICGSGSEMGTIEAKKKKIDRRRRRLVWSRCLLSRLVWEECVL